MPMLEDVEVTPGLNVFVDAAMLAKCKNVFSNTRLVSDETRAANDFRPFLVVALESESVCLCVPLFSRNAGDRYALDQSLKSGPGRGWIERNSYFSPYQFWMIPRDCLIAASYAERSDVGNRQRYASCQPDALAAVAAHRNDSDTDFHPLV